MQNLKIIQAKLFSKLPQIEHGFTTRLEGDFRKKRAKNLILPEQVHGSKVSWVDKSKSGEIIEGVDGLLTIEKEVKIGVKSADCVPLLFFEKRKGIIAAVHAGWRGTLGRIVQKTVKEILKRGGKANSLLAAFGPYIGMCCYEIPKSRAEKFIQEFGKDPLIVSEIGGRFHLNLAYLNYKQLCQSGVPKENIDFPLYCTSCRNDLFFSYRKEKDKGSYGEMLSYIFLK